MKGREKNAGILEMLIVWMLIGGTSMIFANLMNDGRGAGILFITGALVTALLLFIRRTIEHMEILYLGAMLAGLLILFLNISGTIRMLLSIMNHVLTVWNQQYEAYQTLYAVTEYTAIDSMIFCGLLGLMIAVLLSFLVERRYTVGVTIYVFLFLLSAFVLHAAGNGAVFLLLVIGWFSAWNYDTVRDGSFIKSNILFCLIAILIGVCSFVAFRGYDKVQQVDEFEKDIKDGIHNIRYGKDSLPQGDLAQADKLLDNEEENTLNLKFDKIGELHLKGYVGSIYGDNEWKPLSNEAYMGDQAGMIAWLKTQGFDAVWQYAEYKNQENKYGLDNAYINDESYAGTEISVEVKNNGASREYIYLPETVIKEDGGSGIEKQDWQMIASGIMGSSSYSFSGYTGIIPTEIMREPSWLDNQGDSELETYAGAERIYRTFVKEYYTQISAEEKALMNEVFFSGESWTGLEEGENEQLYTATSRIRTVLNIAADYEEHPESLPEGEDFVNWFLEKSGKGNSVHFATAAVLAYRTLGIPARYVEGYYVTEEKAADLTSSGAKEVQLTEKDGHAWVELYADGIGWMPMEVTPGFYSEIYSAENYIEVQEEEVQGSGSDAPISASEKYHSEKEELEEDIPVPLKVLGVMILIAFILAAIYAVLEIQRFIRCKIWKDRLKDTENTKFTFWLYQRICKILKCRKIREGYEYPYQMTEKIIEKFPEIGAEDYKRVVGLLQKESFGGKKLQPHEIHTLQTFVLNLTKQIYQNEKPIKKIKYRYINAI